MLILPRAPSRIFWIRACREAECRHIRPTPTLRFLVLGGLGDPQNPLRAAGIGGKGFFHEDIHAFFDAVFHMRGAEGRVRRLDHHIAGTQTVDRLLVGVEADKPAIGGDIDLLAEFVREGLVGSGLAIREDIGHRVQFRRAGIGGQGLADGAGAPSAAADQGHADGVVLGGIQARQYRRQHRRCGQDLAAVGEKLTAGWIRCSWIPTS